MPQSLPVCLEMMLLPVPLVDEVAPALGDELPLLARDGGFVRQGYDIALDDLQTWG